MTNVSANAEVTPMDTHARGPLFLLIGSGLLWLIVSGVLAVITSIQVHSPGFLADCSVLTYGRAQALQESAFIYGWLGNTGLAVVLWVLGRLGGSPLRALNWAVAGTVFWNLGITIGLVGIGIGDMTGVPGMQLPRYVQALLLVAYAAIAVPGVLAWSGRRTDGTYASQWYGVAALFLFPWLFSAAQIVLLWSPMRGTLQAVAGNWFAQSLWSLWIAPLGLTAAYYIVPKVSGRLMPSYDFAQLGFWTLVFVGGWTGGRHLVGGPVPAWIPTVAVIASMMLLFHYLTVFLNLRIAREGSGTGNRFIRLGLVAYMIVGVLDAITSFRGAAVEWQFTFLGTALEQVGLYGAASMMLFGAIYYMVPRLTGRPWASTGLATGHRILVVLGVVLLVVSLAVAGWTQGSDLMDPKIPVGDIFRQIRLSLMVGTAANLVLLGANLMLVVNFFQSACPTWRASAPAETPFRQPAILEAHLS